MRGTSFNVALRMLMTGDAAAASIGAVIEKVMEKFAPQQATIDPNQIAAIVAATMQAMQPKEEAPKLAAPKPEKKAA